MTTIRLTLALACVVAMPGLTKAQGDLLVAEFDACALESGDTIRECRVAYRTFGELNAERSNAVLIPTQFMATSANLARYIGPDGLADDARYFVVVVDAFGNGVSSSPSNSRAQPGDSFPNVSVRDMVSAQHRLLTEVLGLSSLRGVVGISMGGMQALEWAVTYPGFAAKIIAVASSPRLAVYDIVLWETTLNLLSTYETCQCFEAVAALMGLNFLMAHSPDYHARATPRDSLAGIRGWIAAQALPMPFAKNIAVQVRAMIGHDIAAEFDDSMEQAASRIEADVLVVVTPEDHVVTPGPAIEFARLLGSPALELANDCGHNGLWCDRENLSKAVQAFLDGR